MICRAVLYIFASVQLDVNTLATLPTHTVVDNRCASGCQLAGHSTLQGEHVVRPLTVVSIRLRILHSPQLRHEAVLGRSSSFHRSSTRKLKWERIRREPRLSQVDRCANWPRTFGSPFQY